MTRSAIVWSVLLLALLSACDSETVLEPTPDALRGRGGICPGEHLDPGESISGPWGSASGIPAGAVEYNVEDGWTVTVCAKGGPDNNTLVVTGPASGTLSTPTNPGGQLPALSHWSITGITGPDGSTTTVPEATTTTVLAIGTTTTSGDGTTTTEPAGETTTTGATGQTTTTSAPGESTTTTGATGETTTTGATSETTTTGATSETTTTGAGPGGTDETTTTVATDQTTTTGATGQTTTTIAGGGDPGAAGQTTTTIAGGGPGAAGQTTTTVADSGALPFTGPGGMGRRQAAQLVVVALALLTVGSRLVAVTGRRRR